MGGTACFGGQEWIGWARRLLARLARDSRGNTLILVAACLVPFIALVGSGIDMGRGYLAQTRLQQACDAAALAGRRAMTGGVLTDTVTSEATKFFKFNFPIGTAGTAGSAAFGAQPVALTVGSAANSTVTVSATSTLPTTIMKMFGFNSLPLQVSCYAKQDFVNTDIVLVLDNTGSMDEDVNGNDVNGGATSKIVGLRKAVLALYDQLKTVQDQLEAQGLRLRYGIVPYSSGVNVGAAVRAVSTDYIVNDTYTYQSREAQYKHVIGSKSKAYCDGKGGTTSNQVGTGTSATYTCTWYDADPSSVGGVTTSFDKWNYKPMTYDVSGYVTGASTDTPSQSSSTARTWYGPPATPVKSTWKGCIEERQTSSAITSSSGYGIPSDAYDLNVDLVPGSDKKTKWAPYWPEVEFRGDGAAYDYYGSQGYNVSSKPQVACPTAAKRLQAWTRADLSSYLDTLVSDGGTYHDNGMIWGTRFISPNGIFGSQNPSTYGGMPVSRFIIFMTDGKLDTGSTLYSTYGLEAWDGRVTGGFTSKADQDSRHDQRFRMMCNAAKGMGVSIWVVAFAQALTPSLTECASNSAQASTSADQQALIDRFTEIGKNIGSLRLTQ